MALYNVLHFKSPPVMFAAWPGMGNVGVLTVDYLRRKSNSKLFAEVDMNPYSVPEAITVENGVARLPELPKSNFYQHHNPDMVIFESNGTVGGRDGLSIIKGVLDVAKELNVKKIYTAAGYTQPISHANPSRVLSASSNPAVLRFLQEQGVEPVPDCLIGGLNGLLLGFAPTEGIEAVCFLGTIPAYASSITYPKASLAILDTIKSVLGFDIDLAELEQEVGTVDALFGDIEERMKDLFAATGQSPPEQEPEMQQEHVPQYVMQRIENLFEQVQKDRQKAPELKDELQRWGLFELYEDRFLDLFRDNPDDFSSE
ncbi:MAG: PAC2 family protein, partial [Chitinivibrionales bacterium]